MNSRWLVLTTIRKASAVNLFIFVIALLGGPPARAQGGFSFGSNLGELTWTYSIQPITCVDGNGNFFTMHDTAFSNLVYTPYQGSGQSLDGDDFADYYDGDIDPSSGCPANGPSGTVELDENGYTIFFTPTGEGDGSATIQVPGYINPKYVVVAVVYAPPGSQSNVDYNTNTLVSTTNTVTNTFINSTNVTVKLMGPGGLFAFLGGTRQVSSSTTLTQQSQDSKSVTASYTNTSNLKLYGPGQTPPSTNCGPLASDYIGVDHDCDEILVWVNPVVPLTLVSSGGNLEVDWNGYGYSSLDTTAPIHIVTILVGCLNGDIAPSDSRCAPPLGEFQRTWAAEENWPAGEQPGLTQTDFNNILAEDPWGQCTPSLLPGSNSCPTYSSPGFVLLPPQFTISDLENIPYRQGGTGNGWTVSTTSTTTQGQESMSTREQTFGIEDAFMGSSFASGLGASVSVSRTWTHKHEVNNSTTNSNTFTGMANISPPACIGNPCNPVYPPNPQTFGEATEFDIFVDNFFGTFAFVPSAYN
jgi:hypothetical protein